MIPLLLQESQSKNCDGISVSTVCRTSGALPYSGTALEPKDVSTIEEYGISAKDIRQIYISPHAYNDAFEEELSLVTFNHGDHPTAGLELESRDGRLILLGMRPGAPSHRIPRWRSRIRNAWLVQVDGISMRSTVDVSSALIEAKQQGRLSCPLLFAQPEI